MREAAEFLKNLVFGKEYLKVTIKEGVAAFKPYAKDLETVHIRMDHPDLSTWRKKKYFHILRQVVCSRLDEWIFEHLVDQNEYAAFLERYRPMKAQKGGYKLYIPLKFAQKIVISRGLIYIYHCDIF